MKPSYVCVLRLPDAQPPRCSTVPPLPPPPPPPHLHSFARYCRHSTLSLRPPPSSVHAPVPRPPLRPLHRSDALLLAVPCSPSTLPSYLHTPAAPPSTLGHRLLRTCNTTTPPRPLPPPLSRAVKRCACTAAPPHFTPHFVTEDREGQLPLLPSVFSPFSRFNSFPLPL